MSPSPSPPTLPRRVARSPHAARPPATAGPATLLDEIDEDARSLDTILGAIETLADVDEVLQAFVEELRSLDVVVHPSERLPARPRSSVDVAAEVAAVELRLEAHFALEPDPRPAPTSSAAARAAEAGPAVEGSGVERRPAEGFASGAARPSAAIATPPMVRQPEAQAAPQAELRAGPPGESYELLAGAAATAAPSSRAAAAKRAGRRRLVLLTVIISGLVAFGGLAVRTAQQAATAEAAELVAATTSMVPAAVATTTPPPAEPAAAEPAPEVPTTAPPTTAPPTTASTPSTAVATTAPVTTATIVPTTAAPTTRVPTTYAAPTTAVPYGFLDCVRARESRGDYSAMNPSGAHGAYQLMPTTARETALRAGRTDLASTPVVNWSRTDQDAMAALLYQWQGAAPWGGGCAYPAG